MSKEHIYLDCVFVVYHWLACCNANCRALELRVVTVVLYKSRYHSKSSTWYSVDGHVTKFTFHSLNYLFHLFIGYQLPYLVLVLLVPWWYLAYTKIRKFVLEVLVLFDDQICHLSII